MNITYKKAGWALVVCMMAGNAPAQDAPAAAPVRPPAKSTAQMDAGEPRANTSEPTATNSDTPASGPAPRPGAVTHAATKASVARAAAAPVAKPGNDRLDLGTATVTGDHEQPKVMYIVPWKRADIGDGSGKPLNSLLDEALAPVDRDEFKREVVYYDAVNAKAPQNGASSPATKQGEK